MGFFPSRAYYITYYSENTNRQVHSTQDAMNIGRFMWSASWLQQSTSRSSTHAKPSPSSGSTLLTFFFALSRQTQQTAGHGNQETQDSKIFTALSEPSGSKKTGKGTIKGFSSFIRSMRYVSAAILQQETWNLKTRPPEDD